MRKRRICSTLLFFILVLHAHAGEMAIGETKLVFAPLEQARGILGASDAFSQSMSVYDRRMRMKAEADPGEKSYLEFAADQALEWKDAERAQVELEMNDALLRLNRLRLSLPETVYLVRSTGDEDTHLPYTRANAIIVPRAWGSNYSPMVIHELFHVMSRHDPALRSRLFKVIGFARCEPIEVPEPARGLLITNPDSPKLDHIFTMEADGRRMTLVPILISGNADYDVNVRGGYMKYMHTPFMEVMKEDGRWVPVMRQGSVSVPYSRANYDQFIRQVGRIEHVMMQPEEIMACNFAHFVRSPELIKRFREQFGKGKKVDATTSATADGPANLKIMEAMEREFRKGSSLQPPVSSLQP